MLRAKNKLTILLTPEHLSVSRMQGGKVVQAERVHLDTEKWSDSWSCGLRHLDQPLRQILARFGGSDRKWDADLFYTSPGSICRVDLDADNEDSSTSGMIKGLHQSTGGVNPADAIALCPESKGGLVLGVADTDSNLQQLFAWLNRSKIYASRMLPFNASVVQQAVLRTQDAPEDSITLYLSNRSSVIGYFEDGNAKLVRLIDMGYDSLTDVYRRAILQEESEREERAPDQNTQSYGQPKEQCSSSPTDEVGLLFEHGIPIGRDAQNQQFAKLMPALAPVLQRICIEIKQTLRFASSLDRTPANLWICGPGAAIPHIGAALGQSLDLHVDVDPLARDYRPQELFGMGTDSLAASCEFPLGIELVPKVAKEIKTRKDLGLAVKIGAATAAAFLGGQFLLASHHSDTVESQISQQSTVIDQIETDRDRRQAIGVMAGSIGAAALLIEETMGTQTDWVSLLGSMPNEDHDLIQISEVQGVMNANHPIVNLTGTAIADESGADASQVLSRYIQSLKKIGSVNRITIGSTSRSRIDETTWGLNFVLSIEMAIEDGRFSELTKLSLGESD